MKTKIIFCANCQNDTDHALEVNQIGEIIATCSCGRFLKFPPGLDLAQINTLIEEHKTANEGQIKTEVIDKQIESSQSLIDEIAN